MNKRFSGNCLVHDVKVNGTIEFKDASTNEGTEYAKLGVECDHKVEYKCTRNNCPFWKNT